MIYFKRRDLLWVSQPAQDIASKRGVAPRRVCGDPGLVFVVAWCAPYAIAPAAFFATKGFHSPR